MLAPFLAFGDSQPYSCHFLATQFVSRFFTSFTLQVSLCGDNLKDSLRVLMRVAHEGISINRHVST